MKRKNKRRNRGSQTQNFMQLEARNLLTSIANTLPVGVDLVTNGGFERAVNGNSGFFQDSDVDGWVAADAASGQRLNIFNFGAGSDPRQNILELDSTTAQFDEIFQDINTRAGDSYILSFEIRERNVDASANADTNKLEVLWGDTVLGNYTGTFHWQSVNLVVEGLGDVSRLTFREVSTAASDSRGPLIDNVGLVKIAENVAIGNGSFDSRTLPDSQAQLVNRDFVDGWEAFTEGDSDLLFAIQNTGSNDGGQHLRLDTFGDHLDRIYQDVSTTAGEKYYLTFDLRGSEQLRVRWNNQWAGTFEADTDWQTFGLLLDASDAETTRMVFREVSSTAPTGTGPQIDNVRISRVGVFEPFAGVRALSEVDPAARNGIYSEAPELNIDVSKTFRAKIAVESGSEIDLLLYADRTPETVNNFVNLARDGWYDGLTFNRVVNDFFNNPFIAQAGGPFTENTGGGPGYTFGDEFVDGLNFDTRTGLLAMANAGPATNGSQFFITYGNPTNLNGVHTIFGEIELGDTSSFDALNNLTFREPGSSTPGDVITSITITEEDSSSAT